MTKMSDRDPDTMTLEELKYEREIIDDLILQIMERPTYSEVAIALVSRMNARRGVIVAAFRTAQMVTK